MPYSDEYPSCVPPRRAWSDFFVQVDSCAGVVSDRRIDSRVGGLAIYVRNDVAAAVAPYDVSYTTQELEGVVCCAVVCAVKTADEIIVATVHVRPTCSKRNAEDL